jgi:O-antigen/teichoic acid export membrane protein
VVSKKFVRLRFKGNCDQWKYLLKEAYPIGIKAILRKLNFRIDTLILAAMKGNVEVGLFHGAYKMIQSLMFLAEGATRAIFPLFSRYATTSKESLQQGYEKSFKFLILIGLPFGIFFSYFSKPVITLILGKAFVDATPVLQIFGWVLALMFLNNLMQKMLIVGGKQSYIITATVISLFVNITLDVILISRWSYVGASFATLVSEIVMFGLAFYFVFKHVSYIPISKVALKPIFASITTCVILFYIYQINIYMAVSCGILIYAVTLYLIKTFTQGEISIFKQLIGRRKQVLD